MTVSTTKLSTVIATYNRRESLLRTLSHLAAQDLPAADFEVIVVDDGSREPVRQAVESLGLPFRCRVVEQANAGAAAARHAGVTLATGDIVVFVDDDMTLPPHFLRAHLACHERGYDVVLGYMRPGTDLPLFERFHADQLERFVAKMRQGMSPQGSGLFTGNASLRRADYLAVGGFDPSLKLSEDRDLGIRLELHGARFTFSTEAYSVHESDHASLETWLTRAFRYGIYDSRIAAKYPHLRYVDPWHFLFHANPLATSLWALAAAVPSLGGPLARAAMWASAALDARGFERIALKGTTVAHGLEYFRGVREEAGSLRRSMMGLRAYLRKS